MDKESTLPLETFDEDLKGLTTLELFGSEIKPEGKTFEFNLKMNEEARLLRNSPYLPNCEYI